MPKSFVKWVGGKQQLLGELLKQLPHKYAKYAEPFVGGGALFFSVRPENALLADSNGELINAYQVVRDDVEALMQSLSAHVNESDYFYKVRATPPMTLTNIERASRFIYLNKTCFNGLYRVNKKNEFNAPFGKYKNPTICDKRTLKAANRALQGVTLQATYFQTTLAETESNSFVYLDPPYLPVSDTSFTSYSKKEFGVKEHSQLADCFDTLSKRGVKCLLSSSDVKWSRDRYQDYKIIEVSARRSINSNGKGRGKTGELLIRNY